RSSPMLFARYIPRETGERLIAANINFLDLAGNMHLVLGKQYHRTVLGHAEAQRTGNRAALTPAKMQLLYLFAAEPDAMRQPVRQIAAKAGVSKSNAAKLRQELIEERMVLEHGRGHGIQRPEDILLSGYTQVLRPKIMIGRFRSAEKDPAEFLKRLRVNLA